MYIKLLRCQHLEFYEDFTDKKQIGCLHLENMTDTLVQIKVRTSNPNAYQAERSQFTVQGYESFRINIQAQITSIDKDDRIQIQAWFPAGSLTNSIKQGSQQFFGTIDGQQVQELIVPIRIVDKYASNLIGSNSEIPINDNPVSMIVRSQFLNQYTSRLKSNLEQSYQTIGETQDEQYKQQYENLLMMTDEQEKELFQLGECKSRLQRQLQKRNIIVEQQKSHEINNIHFGYGILIVVLCFVIGMFIKD